MKPNLTLCLILLPFVARGGEVLLPLALDSTNSSLVLTLSVLSDSDSDTQPLHGSILLAVDHFEPLASVSLRDFQFRAVSNYQFDLRSGMFTAGVTNLEVVHGNPGPIQPYVPVSPGGQVTFQNVPHKLHGTGAYVATESTCDLLTIFNVPCHDVINLAERETSPIANFYGVLSISKGVLQFSGNFQFSGVQVAPATTISGMSSIVAKTTIQPTLKIRLGDFLGDHVVTWSHAFHDFILYRATSLSPPVSWEPVDPFFIFDDGTVVSATFPNEDGRSAFYRLSSE